MPSVERKVNEALWILPLPIMAVNFHKHEAQDSREVDYSHGNQNIWMGMIVHHGTQMWAWRTDPMPKWGEEEEVRVGSKSRERSKITLGVPSWHFGVGVG